MANIYINIFLLCVGIFTGVNSVPRNANTIRDDVLKRENPNVRPEDLTVINITFVLTSLNKLDTVSQELSTTFLLHMAWTDPRLEWDPQPGEPEDLVFYVKEIWTPPLVVSNTIEDDIYLLKDNIVPMRVSSNGTVIWTPRVSPLTTCEIDISKFPADSQICHINVTTWVHSTSELDLREAATEQYKDAANMDLYNDNAWNLTTVEVESQNHTGISGIEFKNIKYTLYFTRHKRFHWALMIIPFCCISFLMALTFLVPSEYQGFKVSYSVSLMLSFQLYLSLLQRLLPPVFSERDMNVLGEYTSAVMIYGTVITALLIIQLVIVHYVRKYVHKASILTGVINGTIQDTTSAVLSGTIEGSINRNSPGDIEGSITIYKHQKPDTKYSLKGFVVVSSSFPTNVVMSITELKKNSQTGGLLISNTLNGIMTAPGNMSGKFKGNIAGIIENGKGINSGRITGKFTCCKWTNQQIMWFIDFVFNLSCFIVCFVVYVVKLVQFLSQLQGPDVESIINLTTR